LNATGKKLFVISSPKEGGREQIDAIDVETFAFSQPIRIQQAFTYESLDIKLTEQDRYLIIRARISENEYEKIKDMWKKGKFLPQNRQNRHKFLAVDLSQKNGSLMPRNRILSNIPTLGTAYVTAGPSTVFITGRQ